MGCHASKKAKLKISSEICPDFLTVNIQAIQDCFMAISEELRSAETYRKTIVNFRSGEDLKKKEMVKSPQEIRCFQGALKRIVLTFDVTKNYKDKIIRLKSQNSRANPKEYNNYQLELIELNLRKLDIEVEKISKALKKIKEYSDVSISKVLDCDNAKEEMYQKVIPEEYSSGNCAAATSLSFKGEIYSPTLKQKQPSKSD